MSWHPHAILLSRSDSFMLLDNFSPCVLISTVSWPWMGRFIGVHIIKGIPLVLQDIKVTVKKKTQ